MSQEEIARIGIDLGGHTATAALVVSGEAGALPRIVRKISAETPEGRSARGVMMKLAEMAEDLAAGPSRARVAGVGLALPGMIDADRRHARRLPNFPAGEWDDLDVPEALERAMRSRGLELPVTVENDANCYALGEGSAGEAAGSGDFVVFTLGTGVGGGIVLGGKLLTGFRGMAGEIGHIVAAGSEPCGCGGVGHAETLAGADGVRGRAEAAGLPGAFPGLWALRGDPKADAALEPGLDALARAIASVCHTLDPEMVILGGGISRAPGIRDAVRGRALRYLSKPFRDTFDLRISKLGNDAALYGAACI